VPIYEYRCRDCRRRVSIIWRSFAEAEQGQPVCPRCGSGNLTRLISRVRVIRSTGGSLDDLSDPAALADLDENDPRAMARLMRRMADETGEDLGPEMEEVIDRLEAGEDPEAIEKSMPELMGEGDEADFGEE